MSDCAVEESSDVNEDLACRGSKENFVCGMRKES
jgi:hypothetical protein